MNLSALSPRVRRVVWIVAAVLVLFTVTGFFLLPPIVRSQLEKRLSTELDRPVTVGKVRLNPYALSVTVERFDVREKTGDASFVGWDRLYVNFDLLASLTGDWVLSAVELDGPHARVVVNADGSFNFSDLLAKFAAPAVPVPAAAAPAKASRPVRVGSFKFTGATLDFTDNARPAPFHTTVGPTQFTLTGFRTVGDRQAPTHFEAVTESGEKFAWEGWVIAEPFRSGGEVRVENLLLKKYAPYYGPFVRADLTDGKLTLRGRYEANLDPKNRLLKLIGGAVQLRDLRVVERAGGRPAVELAALNVVGVDADALTRQAIIRSVSLSGGHVTVRREKDGTLNLLTMLQPAAPPASATLLPPPSPAVAPAAPAPALPDLTVGEFALKDFALDVSDLAAPRPAQLGLRNVQLSVKSIALASGAPMPLRLSFGWAPQGTVEIDGTVALKPAPSVQLKTVVAGLEILPLSPYLEQFVNARITQGAVSSTTDVQAVLADGTPAVTLTGGVTVEKFGLVDGAHSEDLAGFSHLALKGLKVTTAPNLAVALDEVVVAGPYARVVMQADRTLNLAMVAKSAAAPAPTATTTVPPPPAQPAPKIEIGKVTIADGEFSYADRSLEPQVKMAVGQFGGTISGLSADNPARADVDLKATVDGVGPVVITGKLDPLGARKFVELKVDVRGVDLSPLSPYSGKYAGYELARGKLRLDVKLRLDDRNLNAADVVTLDQFTFGSATNSPDATGLPVRLGVALLKDLNGKIVIDLPVKGSLDDPNFRIGKVVWRVIGNLLTKAAVSPFSLLGSMFGGGGDELAYQDFAAGDAALLPEESQKLVTLVKALTNRPGLNLDIEGGYDTAADMYALKQLKLTDLVRRQIWEARHAVDPNIPPPEQLTISPEESAAMVKKLFDEKFPPGTQFGAPLPPPPVVTAPPRATHHGLLRRVADVITFKRLREKSPAKPAEIPPTAGAGAPGSAVAAAGLPLAEMTARLADTMDVGPDDLRALAATRAQQVRDYFIKNGPIAPERLFLAKSTASVPAQGKGPRVFLSLQ